jgi:hypothetical protein
MENDEDAKKASEENEPTCPIQRVMQHSSNYITTRCIREKCTWWVMSENDNNRGECAIPLAGGFAKYIENHTAEIASKG